MYTLTIYTRKIIQIDPRKIDGARQQNFHLQTGHLEISPNTGLVFNHSVPGVAYNLNMPSRSNLLSLNILTCTCKADLSKSIQPTLVEHTDLRVQNDIAKSIQPALIEHIDLHVQNSITKSIQPALIKHTDLRVRQDSIAESIPLSLVEHTDPRMSKWP